MEKLGWFVGNGGNMMMKRMFFMVVLSMLLTDRVWASELNPYISKIQTCAKIKDNMSRLSCYDEVANLPLVSPQPAEATKTAPVREPEFAALEPKRDKEAKEARYFDVRSVSKTSRGLVVTLENGQVWRQKGGNAGQVPKGKLTARIKPASLGSYFLTLKNEAGKTGRKGVRFKRVQ